jgi:hypothetical protein
VNAPRAQPVDGRARAVLAPRPRESADIRRQHDPTAAATRPRRPRRSAPEAAARERVGGQAARSPCSPSPARSAGAPTTSCANSTRPPEQPVRDPTAQNGQARGVLHGALARETLPSFGTSRRSPEQTSCAKTTSAKIGTGQPPRTRPGRSPPPHASTARAPLDRAPPRRSLPLWPRPPSTPATGGRGPANENRPTDHNPSTPALEAAGPAVRASRGSSVRQRDLAAHVGGGRHCYTGARVSLPPARTGAPGGHRGKAERRPCGALLAPPMAPPELA